MEKKINVLMIPTWYSPKDAEVMTAGVFHYEQSVALKNYCNVALYYPFDADLKEAFVKQEEKGLLTYRSKLYGGRLWKYIRWMRDFRKIKKEFQPDILHAHVASIAGRLAILLGKLYRIPVVITEHNAIELMGLESRKIKSINRWIYKSSKANVSVSSNSRERLHQIFPEAHFRLIHNGIVHPSKVSLDAQVYAVPGRVNCCIVAAFYNRDAKGYQYLLPAVGQLVKEGVPITLHICGGGEYLDDYINMAEELGIREHCVFYGSCKKETVYSIMKQMDFCISASLIESAGIAVEEAMLLGKPLVVTKSGGANSLVTPETAIVVDRGSVSALADGMRQMSKQLEQFDAKQIQEYAINTFDIDAVSRQYVELYEGILETR